MPTELPPAALPPTSVVWAAFGGDAGSFAADVEAQGEARRLGRPLGDAATVGLLDVLVAATLLCAAPPQRKAATLAALVHTEPLAGLARGELIALAHHVARALAAALGCPAPGVAACEEALARHAALKPLLAHTRGAQGLTARLVADALAAHPFLAGLLQLCARPAAAPALSAAAQAQRDREEWAMEPLAAAGAEESAASATGETTAARATLARAREAGKSSSSSRRGGGSTAGSAAEPKDAPVAALARFKFAAKFSAREVRSLFALFDALDCEGTGSVTVAQLRQPPAELLARSLLLRDVAAVFNDASIVARVMSMPSHVGIAGFEGGITTMPTASAPAPPPSTTAASTATGSGAAAAGPPTPQAGGGSLPLASPSSSAAARDSAVRWTLQAAVHTPAARLGSKQPGAASQQHQQQATSAPAAGAPATASGSPALPGVLPESVLSAPITFPRLLDVLYPDCTADQRVMLRTFAPAALTRDVVRRVQRVFDRLDTAFRAKVKLGACVEALLATKSTRPFVEPLAGLSLRDCEVAVTCQDLLIAILQKRGVKEGDIAWARTLSWLKPAKHLTAAQRADIASLYQALARQGQDRVLLADMVRALHESARQADMDLTAEELREVIKDVGADEHGRVSAAEFHIFYRDLWEPFVNFDAKCLTPLDAIAAAMRADPPAQALLLEAAGKDAAKAVPTAPADDAADGAGEGEGGVDSSKAALVAAAAAAADMAGSGADTDDSAASMEAQWARARFSHYAASAAPPAKKTPQGRARASYAAVTADPSDDTAVLWPPRPAPHGKHAPASLFPAPASSALFRVGANGRITRMAPPDAGVRKPAQPLSIHPKTGRIMRTG